MYGKSLMVDAYLFEILNCTRFLEKKYHKLYNMI
jgi:hypothetical protein